jgi:mannosyl-3-phosphoglycerate phosphatase family protein
MASRRETIAVFTAMDGALLDSNTFDPGESGPIVRRLHEESIPVIPVSVMTLQEIEPIASELGIRQVMILEAGGAIARWKNGHWELEACGPPAEMLLEAIARIEERSGANLLVYSALSDSDAARFSGRSGAMLQASTRRYFSEPFALESGDLGKVTAAAESLGFSIRRGRRFFHLCRACDEGGAFTRICDELRIDVAIGVGGSSVDAEFLARCDVAIIMPHDDGEPDGELAGQLPHARIAPASGPAGWAAAVDEALRTAAHAHR